MEVVRGRVKKEGRKRRMRKRGKERNEGQRQKGERKEGKGVRQSGANERSKRGNMIALFWVMKGVERTDRDLFRWVGEEL